MSKLTRKYHEKGQAYVPSVFEVLVKAKQLYFEHFRLIFILSFLSCVILYLAALHLVYVGFPMSGNMEHFMKVASTDDKAKNMAVVAAPIMALWLFMLAYFIQIWVFQPMITVLVNMRWYKKMTSLKSAWSVTRRALTKMILVTVFIMLLEQVTMMVLTIFSAVSPVLLSIAFVIMMIFINAVFFIAIPLCLFEPELRFKGVISTAIQLFQISPERNCLFSVLCFLIDKVSMYIMTFGVSSMGQLAPGDMHWIFGVKLLVFLLVSAFLMPFTVSLTVSQYHALRTMKPICNRDLHK